MGKFMIWPIKVIGGSVKVKVRPLKVTGRSVKVKARTMKVICGVVIFASQRMFVGWWVGKFTIWPTKVTCGGVKVTRHFISYIAILNLFVTIFSDIFINIFIHEVVITFFNVILQISIISLHSHELIVFE